MNANRPFCLSIAGFDPTGGAGILADIKTFEMVGVYGMGIISSNTLQTDSDFREVQWMDFATIKTQMECLFASYDFGVMKIGLVENFETLQQIITLARTLNPAIQIVWDPILKSSSGFNFHATKSIDLKFLEDSCTLITPNWNEFEMLWGSKFETLISLKPKASILIKGGHREQKKGCDVLYSKGSIEEIEGVSFHGKTKHGTGCVFSAAITAFLTKNVELKSACFQAKKYVERFIVSNDTNLGFHYVTE